MYIYNSVIMHKSVSLKADVDFSAIQNLCASEMYICF